VVTGGWVVLVVVMSWWWGFTVSSGIQIRGRCLFVFASHRCRLEKLVKGMGG